MSGLCAAGRVPGPTGSEHFRTSTRRAKADPAASSSLPNAENESRLSPVTASARNQNAGQSQEGIRRFCGGSPAGIDGRFIRNDLELGGGVDETDLAAVKETPASYSRVHLTLKLDRVRDSAAQEPDARARDT